jgi:O-antigen ligase
MATSSIPYAVEDAGRRALLLPMVVGFFYAFRGCITVLWFQSDPQIATYVVIACDLLLMCAALFSRLGDPAYRTVPLLRSKTLRWILAFLALSCCSLLWTQAKSVPATAGYWANMAAEVFTAMLLVGNHEPKESTVAMIKGFIYGACVVALVAWLMPTLPDNRLGNEEVFNPNGIGLLCALASLCAQYLRSRGERWRWISIALAVTVLRTISKTSIIAYMIAETFYLLRNRDMQRRTKIYIGLAAAFVIACFATLLESYFELYATTGDQAESLTGRTWIWAVSFSMAIEKPLLGYGIYAYRNVIPAFGAFEPWHAHNEFLQQFFEYGAVGVFLLAALYWSFFRAACRSRDSKLRMLALTLLVFSLVHGLTDTVNFGFTYPLWLLTAVSITFAASERKSTEAAG